MTLIMCKLFGSVGAEHQPSLNVFGYKSNLVIANELPQFEASFEASILTPLVQVLHGNSLFTRVEVLDLGDPTNEYIKVISPPVSGVGTGDSMPPWITWSFEYRRLNRTQRSGRKGFGQINESAQNDGVPTSSFQTTLEALAVTLGSPLKLALIDTWFPVILHRPVPPSTVWVDHPLQVVIFKGIGSQNTRKRR